MVTAKFSNTIDQSWTAINTVRIGNIPDHYPTPDRYVTVSSNDKPLLRIDIHADPDDTRQFEDIAVYRNSILIGFGHHVYYINPADLSHTAINLGSYFAQFHPFNNHVLAASGERLFKIGTNGSLLWKTARIGIDGVKVNSVCKGVIKGEGDWDPPDGWRPFAIDLETGVVF